MISKLTKKQLSHFTLLCSFLVSILLVFYHFGATQFSAVGFLCLFMLAIGLALYSPRLSFLLFVTLIPLEFISVAPDFFPIAIRPYQLIGALTIFSLIMHATLNIKRVSMPKMHLVDILLMLVIGGSFLALFNAPNVYHSFTQTLILLSFFFLYYLIRFMIQKKEDLIHAATLFIASSGVVLFYSILQNISFLLNFTHNESMPGRPNGSFSEADWLGMFTVVIIAFFYTVLLYIFSSQTKNASHKYVGLLSAGLLITYITLIITVARSAWLAALCVHVVMSFVALRHGGLRTFLISNFYSGILFVCALGLSILLPLTNFELQNRAQSTAGQQEITIACTPSRLPSTQLTWEVIQAENYPCTHINLEDVRSEQNKGNTVLKVLRADPNVSARKDIYTKSFALISEHPFLGIGWGSSGAFLGFDDSGTMLNSSNLFLQTWLGSGIIGFLSIAGVCAYVFYLAASRILQKKKNISSDAHELMIFIACAMTGIVVANLFNAGLLLMFIWLVFALIPLIKKL